MSNLSGDPYQGARRAYFVLDPTATDNDWEQWAAEHTAASERGFDNFGALANICRAASKSVAETERDLHQLLAFATGYFEALELVIGAAWMAQPVSVCVPMHLSRHKRQVVRPETQFEE